MPRRAFKCPSCPKNYGSQEKLDEHKVIHKQRPFVCHHCNRNFINKRGISRHMRVHIINNPSDHLNLRTVLPCPICRKCFPTKEALHSHKSAHSTPYECEICKKTFFYKWRWVYHLTNGCTNRLYTCHHCEKNFKSKDAIALHIRSHHIIKKHRYTCKLCPMSSSSKINYLYHVYKHTGQKGFVCSICDKKFARNESLQNHKKTHTNDTFECEFCLKRFTRRFALKNHRRLHTRDTVIACKVCHKAFQYKYQLDVHMLSHGVSTGDAKAIIGNSSVDIKAEPDGSETETAEDSNNFSYLMGNETDEEVRQYDVNSIKKPVSCPKCSVVCRSELGLKKHMKNTVFCNKMAIAFAKARDKTIGQNEKCVKEKPPRRRPKPKEVSEVVIVEEEDPSVPLKPKCYHFDYATKQYVPLYFNITSPANIIAPPIIPAQGVATPTPSIGATNPTEELADDAPSSDSFSLDNHRPNNRFLCLFCKKVFLSVSELMAHASVAHIKETRKIKEEQLDVNQERFFFKVEPMSDYEYEGNSSYSEDGEEPPLLNVEVTMSDENSSAGLESERGQEVDAGRNTVEEGEVDPLEGPPSLDKQQLIDECYLPPLIPIVKQGPSANGQDQHKSSFKCADIQKILIKREGSLLKAILTESKEKERFCSPDLNDADELGRVNQVDIKCS